MSSFLPPIFSKQNEGLSLLVDIQSGLVRCSLVFLGASNEEKSFPKIIHSISRAIVQKEHIGGESLTKAMLSVVGEVSSRVVEEGILRLKSYPKSSTDFHSSSIKSVHYILSSPWIISQTKTIKIQYDVDTDITSSMIQGILDEERTALLSKFKKENLEKDYDFDLTFIEQKIFDMRLNGYPVESYKGKKARTFELSFAVTLSSEKILESIHKTISAVVHTKKNHHHSGLILQYIALMSLIDKNEYISVHIHGELTDAIVIKKGLSSSISSFPYGISTLVKKMSISMKNTIEASSSLLSIYGEDHMDNAEKDRLEKVLTPLAKDWQSQLLSSFPSPAPNLVYLSICSVSNKQFGIFKKILETAGFEVMAFDKSLTEVYVSALSQLSDI